MKKIILCLDGTWNGVVNKNGKFVLNDKETPATNVLKIFNTLQGQRYTILDDKEYEKVLIQNNEKVQIAKYIHGVGDSNGVINKYLEGIFGKGVLARIIRGYSYISRNYEAGDEIYIIGFSRGAYTARVIAGMIASEGLIKGLNNIKGDQNNYSKCFAVWTKYRKKQVDILNPNNFEDLATKYFKKGVLEFVDLFRSDIKEMITPVQIEVIGVWDTVGSLGIPSNNPKELSLFEFFDTSLHENVKKAYHAVSLDERRATFSPTLWDAREGIDQTIFSGAHSDVGGGYPQSDNESGLSDITLEWMVTNLKNHGIAMDVVEAEPNPLGIGHEEWHGGQAVFTDILIRDLTQLDTFHPSIKERYGKYVSIKRGDNPISPPDRYAPENYSPYEQ